MKTLNLTKVIFLLFSFFSSSVTPLNAAEVSSLDEELLSMDIHEENAYPYVENSNQEVSTLLFLENDAEYYIYFYLPTGIVQYDFLTIQLGICVSDSFDDLNSDSNLEVNNYTLEYVDTTNNGCVAKYTILDMEDTLHTYDHRRYSIRQVYMKYDNILHPTSTAKVSYFPYWQTLGDEYYYYQDLNGQTAYQYKKAEFVSLTYKEVWSYYFRETNNLQNLFGINKGTEHYFYGFTPDREIDTLKEVELIYNKQSLAGRRVTYNVPFFITSEDNFFNAEFGPVEKENVIILEGESVSQEDNDGVFRLFFKRDIIKWNRISTYEELIQNEDKQFANFIKKNFLGAEYVVNFASYDYRITETSYLFDEDEWNDNGKLFKQYLEDNNATSVATGGYRYHIFKGTYISEVQMIRMRYETNGIEYNIQVITDPINSSGTGITEGSVPLWMIIVGIVLILFVLSLVIRILSPIFKMIGSFFKFIFSGFKRDK